MPSSCRAVLTVSLALSRFFLAFLRRVSVRSFRKAKRQESR